MRPNLESAAGPLIKDTKPKVKKNMGLEGIGRKYLRGEC